MTKKLFVHFEKIASLGISQMGPSAQLSKLSFTGVAKERQSQVLSLRGVWVSE